MSVGDQNYGVLGVANLRNQFSTEPKATDEKRYEALRLACEAAPHRNASEVVERATVYFNFLSGIGHGNP